jgi:AraC-like DNA-binding protein
MQGGDCSNYFRLTTPVSALAAASRSCGISLQASEPDFTSEFEAVLELRRQDQPMERICHEQRFIPVIPFPQSTRILVSLLLVSQGPAGVEKATLYLPRRAFDDIVVELGADRMTGLVLAAGAAIGDPVIENLFVALSQQAQIDPGILDHIGNSFISHLAQHYASLRFTRPLIVGGLTPRQLRQARETIEARLDQEISLAQLAGDCGLSTSHFARAFARSIGVPPHRWLMQRRVERAKQLMLTGATLAEIALMCGFSDQSHLTRVFAQAVGITPGRWRESEIGGHRHSPALNLGETKSC